MNTNRTFEPFRPFEMDTRKRLEGENKHKHMDFLKNLLNSVRLPKFETWLKDVSYQGLFRINKIFWEEIAEDGTVVDQPSYGGIVKLRDIIKQMDQRNETLPKYIAELKSDIEVQRLHEILVYLLRISNYPMETATNDNVAGYFPKILYKGRKISFK